jgi:hypothetical protein
MPGTVKVGLVQRNSTIGAPNWFQLASAASPDSGQIQFGTDNTGYAFGIAKNVSGTITTLARFYDGGSGTTTFRLYGSMEADGNITLPNGSSLYGRRATGNAQVAFFRYDSGTDDLSTVIGGAIWRIRDTGAGVPMYLTSGGNMVLAGTLSTGPNQAILFGWSGGGAQQLLDLNNRVASTFVVGDRTSSFPTRLCGLGVTVEASDMYLATVAGGQLGRFNYNATGLSMLTPAGAAWGARMKWGLFSDAYSDESLVPALGIYTKGGLLSGSNVALNATGTSFINGRGHKMTPQIISSSAPSGVAEDGTLWIKV